MTIQNRIETNFNLQENRYYYLRINMHKKKGRRQMNITFFIGNGFDINLGLNTKYSDFYPYFIEKSTITNMIRAWLQEDELLWADLEEQLGKELENVEESKRESGAGRI